MSKKGNGRFVFGVLLGLCFSGWPAAAQSTVEVLRESFDVLQAQSGLVETWRREELPAKVKWTRRPNPTLDIPMRAAPFDAKATKTWNTDPMDPTGGAAIELPTKPASDSKVRWIPAVMESLYYTGIMHAFNLTFQPGTRDTLNGHWFQHYASAVSELRGWSDGDTFMAPYVGHSIEGSAFGYILRQNDPKYRTVQLGDGRDYYVSLLRSLAYSAVWHTQWKIGPASEASIGNVMLHTSPGFITLVDTPTLGVVTMFAEDAADRHLIIGLENRTSNRAIIMLARCFLNPGRTMANMSAFRTPWARDTRLGLFGTNYEMRKELLREYREEGGEKPFVFVKRTPVDSGIDFKKDYRGVAPIELQAFSYYESFLGGGSCIGGGGQGAARVNSQLQIVTEVSGCLVMHMPQSNQSGDSLFYGAGPRWVPKAGEKFSPYVQVLVGGRRVTYEVNNGALQKELMKEWSDGEGTLAHYPTRFDWSVERQANGFSLAAGSGLDVVFTRAFAWRVLNVEYTHSWLPDVEMIRAQNGIKVTTGAVLRIGTW